MLGALCAAAGGFVAGYAVLIGSFAWMVAGNAIAGFGGAFAAQYRFAAADSGTPAFRARAISWVLTGGVAAGVMAESGP